MSTKKKIAAGLLVTVAIVTTIACSNTYLGRYVRWNLPDVYDLTKFPSVPIGHSGEPRQFVESLNPTLTDMIVKHEGVIVPLKDLLAQSKTRAFIVLRNDTIIAENYPLGDTRETLFKSYSMTKSVLSLLIGIAIAEKKITSVNDPVGKYIKDLSPAISHLTIKECLQQTTRIQYNESYWPWSDEPSWYYTTDARALTKRVVIDKKRTSKYENVEYNVLLLGMVLENATGTTISRYLEEKIWKLGGMEQNASFSIDSEKKRFEKVGDGLNTRPMDMVRLGKLLLDSGAYHGSQLIPAEWISESTSFEKSIPSNWNNTNYNYLWWVLKNGDYYANGHFGQYIYVSPRTKTVIVRLGEESAGICWWCVWPQMVDVLE
ncbi:MAG: serine hydrolase domain-containing protein [Cyclobacteriaceae bacterium]